MPETIDVIKQVEEASSWRNKASIEIKNDGRSATGVKLFEAIIDAEDETHTSLSVSSRSKALRHAFEYCDANGYKVTSVTGVRSEKYKLS